MRPTQDNACWVTSKKSVGEGIDLEYSNGSAGHWVYFLRGLNAGLPLGAGYSVGSPGFRFDESTIARRLRLAEHVQHDDKGCPYQFL